MKLSERSVYSLIKELKDNGKHHGFVIMTKRNEGYDLAVYDEEKYERFKERSRNFGDEENVSKNYRTERIFGILLQQRDFISLQMLADMVGVNRNTIISDLTDLKLLLPP